jgi:Flp pilus assembly protein TadD
MLSRAVEREAMNEEIALGLEAYNRRDAEKAIAALGEAEAEGLAESLRLVYLGSALAWSGEYQKAIGVLNELADTSLPEPWASEALWTKYVSLDRSGRRASADSLLRILADSPDEIGDRARRVGVE